MVPRTWINGIQFTRRDDASTTLLIPTSDRVVARPEAPAPPNSGARERGAVLLLATLSLVLLVVLISQLFVSSTVDQAVARSDLEFTRIEYAARAGVEVAKAVLLSEERPTGRTLHLATDLTVDISFESEDGKLNVLWLACEDEGTRDEWRERFVRLLDGLREGSALDLSLGEAESIVKGIEKHLTVERPPEMPVPALSTMLKGQSKLAWSEPRFSSLIEQPSVSVSTLTNSRTW